ncbi:MAG: DUF721 domain-containing protein [Rickettsiales bacterium]|jgi:hypothetical protein|nr:DUF721 domain-containing protein [Rickettsiales bacterium]
MTSNFSTGNRFVSLATSAKKLLGPVVNEPKYKIIHNILTNWKNIVGEKYERFCSFERIILDRTGSQGTIYLISYNSSASFYLGNNSLYLVDKINSLFGEEIISKILVREIPTIVNPTPREKIKVQKISERADTSETGERLLKSSLEGLRECFRPDSD